MLRKIENSNNENIINNNKKENNTEAELLDKDTSRLPLTSDYVFKRLFAREENNSMLKDFFRGNIKYTYK